VSADLAPIADDFDRRRARSATGLLARFNLAGVLAPADVHVATRVGHAVGEASEEVLLAAALAVRAVRQGSVCVDLATVRDAAPSLPWPNPENWQDVLTASPLVREDVLHVNDGLLYLDRYWAEEGQVCADVRARLASPPPPVEDTRLQAALDQYFPGDSYREQRDAAETACRRWTSLIIGGPGSGKTTTIARFIGTLLTISDRPLRIALAAPTGKAAARMAQAVREATDETGAGAFPADHRDQIAALTATTMHRMLGWQPGTSTRFRHTRANTLPHDVVIIDETSMVSLTLMARLLEAMHPDARLILVGDADQLASVDAGAVLKDLVEGLGADSGAVSTLAITHRYGPAIGALAEAIRRGDADGAVAALQSGEAQVSLGDDARDAVTSAAVALLAAADGGDHTAALTALGSHRLVCAHREGEFGVRTWNRRVERWLLERTGADWLPQWYPGQPLLVTANDYGLHLFNGDTGVVTRRAPGSPDLVACIDTGVTGHGRDYALTRLADVETAHAMTVHRSQGSQFEAVTVLLPPLDSPLLTRELLYTAVTRARTTVRVVGSADAVRTAVHRRAQRASGLAGRLRAQ
jgi:exodeoxyribonuclease V alpha subunit